MPARKQKADDISRLKDLYIEFFRDCPIQKRAAQFICRTEQTIIGWKDSDSNFFNRVNQAEAEFIKKRLLRTGAEYQLERLFKAEFAERKELTGKDGNNLFPMKEKTDEELRDIISSATGIGIIPSRTGIEITGGF